MNTYRLRFGIISAILAAPAREMSGVAYGIVCLMMAMLVVACSHKPDSSAVAVIGPDTSASVAPDFVGVSNEQLYYCYGIPASTNGLNLPYRTLIKALQTSGAPMFVRIGGNATESQPATDPNLLVAMQSLAKDVNLTFAFGVNMKANNPALSAQQAAYYASQVPQIRYIEIGNESEFYAAYNDRPYGYSITDWVSDFNNLYSAISTKISDPKIMGPSWGNVDSAVILPGQARAHWGNTYPTTPPSVTLENAEKSRIDVFSLHWYGAYSKVPSNYLLTPAASTTVGPIIAPVVAVAHQSGQKFRIGEMNSVVGGGQAGVSDTFQASLWAIDQMFELANVGVDGVNWHLLGNTPYAAMTFTNGPWDGTTRTTPYMASVKPLYYGLLLFAQATANTKAIRRVTLTTRANIKVWAVTAKDGSVRVIVIDKDPNFNGSVAIQLPGFGAARLSTLTAPAYTSKTGITLDGQTFDGTTNGVIAGRKTLGSVSEVGGNYSVHFTGVGVQMLTLLPHSSTATDAPRKG